MKLTIKTYCCIQVIKVAEHTQNEQPSGQEKRKVLYTGDSFLSELLNCDFGASRHHAHKKSRKNASETQECPQGGLYRKKLVRLIRLALNYFKLLVSFLRNHSDNVSVRRLVDGELTIPGLLIILFHC